MFETNVKITPDNPNDSVRIDKADPIACSGSLDKNLSD